MKSLQGMRGTLHCSEGLMYLQEYRYRRIALGCRSVCMISSRDQKIIPPCLAI